MNKQLHRLLKIAEKKERTIIGLMSGTSLDGLDIALCKCTVNSIKVEQFATIEYDKKQQEALLALRSKSTISMPLLCDFHTTMAHFYADQILGCLEKWGIDKDNVDLIASHGQTIYHQPGNELSTTFQCVDGDHIAQKTGIPTLSDFRQKHTAAGGEGAPLAKFLDEFLYQHLSRTRVALNLGGIANLTIIPPSDSQKEILSTDIGPANTLINEAMLTYFDKPFDEGGEVAAKGNIHSGLVKYILLEPFFRRDFPKTTGQEVFNLQLIEALQESHEININPTDLVASLTELTVKSIVRAVDALLTDQAFDMIVSGGGVHNQTLMNGLKKQLPQASFMDAKKFGIPGDAKEAALMAFLGFRWFEKQGFEIENEINIHLGKLSLPD
ncbi:MAG: anhydro-N-acetylmuramic acid kinase [Balneolaceae bacterium]|nr:anhydro-N-acetylmuramic acid kinase [Balneolaceae bacterium]